MRYGRYKTVTYSLKILLWNLALLIILCAVYMSSQIEYFFHEGPNVESIGYCIYWIIKFGPFLLITAVFVRCSFVAYSANMIRFGIDQLHDSLAENSILFIFWFVFTCHIGYFTASTVYKNFDCLHITIRDITANIVGIKLLAMYVILVILPTRTIFLHSTQTTFSN